MKTISDYTIYCTEEQTKKALALGAPIELESEYYHPTEHDFKLDNPILCESFTNGYHYAKCPTAEQMLGWLEKQGLSITIYNYLNISFAFELDCVSNGKRYPNRTDVTLAAIDAALEYLLT